MAAAQPEQLGPYRILRRLGVGGMAETFVAERIGPGGFTQQVCLKRILPAFTDNHEFVQLFMEEARLAAQLRHSNVVQVLDFGAEEGSYFMALELVEGLDLRALLRSMPGRRLPVSVAVLIVHEVGAALEYAHGSGRSRPGDRIVHRDLSPSNVLVSTAGEVKLGDFGIAKAMRGTQASATGSLKGKIPYMAPEQMKMEALDGRADLFSLGVMLHEMLTGKRPFDAPTEVATMTRIMAGDREAVTVHYPDCPPALVSVIDKLLAPDADRRFADAAELIDALVDLLPPPVERRRLGKLVREARGRGGATAKPASPDPEPAAETKPASPDPAPAPVHATAPTVEAPAREPEDVADGGDGPIAAEPSPRPVTASTHAGVEPPAPDVRPRRRRLAVISAASVLAVGAGIVAVAASGGGASPTATDEVLHAGRDSAEVQATAVASPGPTAEQPEEEPPEEPAPSAPAAPTSAPSEQDAPAPIPAEPRSRHPSPEAAAGPADREPPAGPAAARPGELIVDCQPWGRVLLDGRDRGPAPQRLRLDPGRYRVGCRASNDQRQEVVRVRAGSSRAVTLEVGPRWGAGQP